MRWLRGDGLRRREELYPHHAVATRSGEGTGRRIRTLWAGSFELRRPMPGRLLVNEESSAMHLIDIALLEDYRNRGIGTHLLNELKRECDSRQMTLRLHVLAVSPARGLYRRMGFAEVGADVDIYPDGAESHARLRGSFMTKLHTLGDFSPYLHTQFQIAGEEKLELTSVTDQSNAQLEQFSLIFTGPVSPCLPQRTLRGCRIRKWAMSSFFWYPSAPTRQGCDMRRAFSRFVESQMKAGPSNCFTEAS